MQPEFEVHMLNEGGIEKAQRIAGIFDFALTRLIEEGLVPPGRYQAIVRTKMEEAAFFAKKALAVVPENQK